MTEKKLYAIIEYKSGFSKGWTPEIVKGLPANAEYHAYMDIQEMIDTGMKFDAIILVGSTARNDREPKDINTTMSFLAELHRDGFSGDVVFLTGYHKADDPKFAKANPRVIVLSKTAVANGFVPLP